jgi:hypothetical protein
MPPEPGQPGGDRIQGAAVDEALADDHRRATDREKDESRNRQAEIQDRMRAGKLHRGEYIITLTRQGPNREGERFEDSRACGGRRLRRQSGSAPGNCAARVATSPRLPRHFCSPPHGSGIIASSATVNPGTAAIRPTACAEG